MPSDFEAGNGGVHPMASVTGHNSRKSGHRYGVPALAGFSRPSVALEVPLNILWLQCQAAFYRLKPGLHTQRFSLENSSGRWVVGVVNSALHGNSGFGTEKAISCAATFKTRLNFLVLNEQ